MKKPLWAINMWRKTWVVTGDSTLTSLYCAGKIVDADGNTVTIKDADGKRLVKGKSEFVITVENHDRMIKIIYSDPSIVACIKPAGILSTDEPGGMPTLVRTALGNEDACVRTVHRLDQVVSGLMVLARSPDAASELSRQIREHVL